MDRREYFRENGKWYNTFDRNRMIVFVWVYIDGGDEELKELPVKMEVCSTCNGTGKHVNPSIDAHGITNDEFADDPDFAEAYFSGMYDVTCYECNGSNVVPAIDYNKVKKDKTKSYSETLEAFEERQRDDADYYAELAAERRMGA